MKSERYEKFFKLAFFGLILFFVLLFFASERLRAYPRYGAAFYKLGMECGDSCGTNRRLRYLKKAVYHDPSLSDAYYQTGLIYDQMGNKREAAENYRRAAKTDYTHRKAWERAGIYFYISGDLDRALRYLTQADRLGKTFAIPNYYLALVYEEKGDYENARIHYSRTLSFDYDHVFHDVYVKVGKLRYRLGDYERAVDQVKRLRNLDETILADELETYLKRWISWDPGTGVVRPVEFTGD